MRHLILGLLIRVLFAALCGLAGASLGWLLRDGLHLTTTEFGVLFCCLALAYVLWMCCRK